MPTVLKQRLPFSPTVGDIIFGAEYLRQHYSEVMNNKIVPLVVLAQNGWTALEKLGIDANDFRLRSVYKCPFMLKNVFFWNMPILLAYSDKNTYLRLREDEYAADSEWHRNMYSHSWDKPARVARALMGHGYTHSTMPDDGSPEIHNTIAELDNGDVVVCATFFWYNK